MPNQAAPVPNTFSKNLRDINPDFFSDIPSPPASRSNVRVIQELPLYTDTKAFSTTNVFKKLNGYEFFTCFTRVCLWFGLIPISGK